MKTPFAVGYALLLAVTTWGQGAIHFANTATTLITTNDFQGHIGNVIGPGNYGFGLYLGPAGSDRNSLMLQAVTTNGLFPGRFDGGNLVPLAGAGFQYSFQVRGWSSFAGGSYEQAYINAINGVQPGTFLGESTLGFFTVPAFGTIEIFGTGPGQVGGFVLTPLPIPEPSTYALAGIGLLALFLLRHPKRADPASGAL